MGGGTGERAKGKSELASTFSAFWYDLCWIGRGEGSGEGFYIFLVCHLSAGDRAPAWDGRELG